MKTTTPREEQEVILNYDREMETWYYYSDVPKYNHKWANLVQAERKEYNNTGQITLLEGTVTGSVNINKRRNKKERAVRQLQDDLS